MPGVGYCVAKHACDGARLMMRASPFRRVSAALVVALLGLLLLPGLSAQAAASTVPPAAADVLGAAGAAQPEGASPRFSFGSILSQATPTVTPSPTVTPTATLT